MAEGITITEADFDFVFERGHGSFLTPRHHSLLAHEFLVPET